MLKQIGEKISEYSTWNPPGEICKSLLNDLDTALSAAGAVEGLAAPEKRPLEFLRFWLKGAGGGEYFPLGTESTIWESGSRAEYVSLALTASNDRISALVRGILLDAYHFFAESLKKVKKKFTKVRACIPYVRLGTNLNPRLTRL